MPLSRERAEELFLPYAETLIEKIRLAWKTYRAYTPAQRVTHSRRSRSSLMSDLMRLALEADLPVGIEPFKVRGLRLFAIGTEAVFRLKKMRRGGRTDNYRTQQK